MSQLVAAYEQLLLDNVSTVSTVESAIRNVTWFLPGRFADGDIASEGLYALLSVVSSGHDMLLEKRVPSELSLPPHPFAPDASPKATLFGSTPAPRVTPLLPPASEHTRYTRYWSERSKTYKRASRALVTITYVELLLEMVAKKRSGDPNRWRLVLGMESIKTTLRLVLLAITGRPVVWPPTPQREYDVGLIPQDRLLGRNGKPKQTSEKPQTEKDNRRPVVNSLQRAPLRTHLYPLVTALPEEYLPSPLGLVPQIESVSELTAEVLSSTAVLVQVILIIRDAHERAHKRDFRPGSLPTVSRSLTPFLVPLLLQLLARRLRASAGDSTLLAEHYSQLDRRMASRFFLQGPMWIGWTRPKIVAVIKTLERIPLIGLAGELIAGYLPLVDDYFYTVT